MITVSGNTWNYRTILQSMGGRWNAAGKSWEFPDNTPQRDLDYMRKMHGVIVTGKRPTYDPNELITRVTGVDHAKPSPPVMQGSTAVYGDDATYLDHFTDYRPKAFFGFSSLAAMTAYIDAIPASHRKDDAWVIGQANWSGTKNMPDALAMARDGWPEGVQMASEVLEMLDAEHAHRRKATYSVAGGRVNVGRMLSGDPLHMKRKTQQPGKKVITLFVGCGMRSGISAPNAILRAACVAAIVDILEMNGFSCEVVSTFRGSFGNGGSTAYATCTPVKSAGEKLNLNDLVFALGHPAFHRRFQFALTRSSDVLRSIWAGMGASELAFIGRSALARNEFFIPHLTPDVQSCIKGTALIDRAHSLLSHILPCGLPLELTTPQT